MLKRLKKLFSLLRFKYEHAEINWRRTKWHLAEAWDDFKSIFKVPL